MWSRIAFTSDLLRVDGVNLDNPQRINVDWIKALFGELIEKALCLPSDICLGSNQDRIRWYRLLDVPFSLEGWASIYEEVHCPQLESELIELFDKSFIVAFELPPYLRKIFNKANLTYIDTCVHYVRFLPDYILGIRSNDPAIMDRMAKSQFPESLFYDFARISRAGTVRTHRDRKIDPGSAFFLGQVEVDTSLIYNSKIAGSIELEDALLQLAASYPSVYYKFHPYRREKNSVHKIVSSIRRCAITDVNMYDAMSDNDIAVVASLSSGGLQEAKFFHKQAWRFLPLDMDRTSLPYVPAPPQISSYDYWSHVLHGTEVMQQSLHQFDRPIRSTLNITWGK
jgi:hypothetical protein